MAEPVILMGCVALAFYLAYTIYLHLWFTSRAFYSLKEEQRVYIEKHNDFNHYILDLNSKNIMESNPIEKYANTSLVKSGWWNMQRKAWDELNNDPKTQYCSLPVLRNAHSQPFKYLCKYFNIEVTKETLDKVIDIGNSIRSVDEGAYLIKKERHEYLDQLKKKVPTLISFFSGVKLLRKLGLEDISLNEFTPEVYTFKYISPDGNASAESKIVFDFNTLNSFAEHLFDTLKRKNNITRQRSLMTKMLRESIKRRDDYVCLSCNASIEKEPNLLLEADHIIPVSKGGRSEEENLQTLCWRCNRSKGTKEVNYRKRLKQKSWCAH